MSDSNDSGALDMHGAADAFSSLDGDAGHDEKVKQADSAESEDDAAARLAAEDAEGGDPEATDPPAAAAPVTVIIDGKSVTLTPEQIAESYKNGLRQADYTQKTMAAAEARKTAEAETTKARTERATYAQQLNNYAIANDSVIREEKARLTEELLVADPIEYFKLQRTVEARQANLLEANQRLDQLKTEHQQEQKAAHESYMQEQQRELIAKLPEWKDEAKANAEVAQIKAHLGKHGFTPEESVFPDHRLVLLARDAMRYHALMERAKGAVKKVAALPVRTERSGSAESGKLDGRTSVMQRLGKTGSIDDAAAAFGALG